MTDLSKEYRIVSVAGGWHPSARRTALSIEGRDATSFLHALVTADLAAVAAGGGTYAAYLTPQGRMIADLALYRLDDRWLADVPGMAAASLAAKLDASIFAEDARVEDRSSRTTILAVVGAQASDILGRVDGFDRARIQSLALRSTLTSGDITIARTDETTLPTFDVFVPKQAVGGVREILSHGGAVAMSEALAEGLRIEAGRPAFGVDMDTDTIPLEAGLLDRAISTTKGCYVGQEIIIRVLHRGGGRVARRLMKIESRQAEDTITAGARLIADGHDVGVITSAGRSPERDRAIALGYVHRDHAIDGREILIRQAGDERMAVVVGAAG
jgi:folate-binding protein YgfZ